MGSCAYFLNQVCLDRKRWSSLCQSSFSRWESWRPVGWRKREFSQVSPNMPQRFVRFTVGSKNSLIVTESRFHHILNHKSPNELKNIKSQFLSKTPIISLLEVLLRDCSVQNSSGQPGNLTLSAHLPFPIGIRGYDCALCYCLEAHTDRNGTIRSFFPEVCPENCPHEHEDLKCPENHVTLLQSPLPKLFDGQNVYVLGEEKCCPCGIELYFTDQWTSPDLLSKLRSPDLDNCLEVSPEVFVQ